MEALALLPEILLLAGALAVLLAGSLLQGFRKWSGEEDLRLLSYQFVGRGVIQSPGDGSRTQEDTTRDLMANIRAEQRAALYLPGYQHTTPPPTLVTDGKTVKLVDSKEVFHPGIYIKDPNTTIDEKEFEHAITFLGYGTCFGWASGNCRCRRATRVLDRLMQPT